MLHAYVQRFDVMGKNQNFLELNVALISVVIRRLCRGRATARSRFLNLVVVCSDATQ